MPELDAVGGPDAAGADAGGSAGVVGSAGARPADAVSGENTVSDARPAGVGAVAGVDTEELGDTLADLVVTTVGVLRIEPTLRGAVNAWRSGDGDDPARHLELTVRGRIVDVGVHVAVAADHQARLLAHRLRERLREHLVGRGLEPGTVEISILVIEPFAG